jgi:predicted nucleic acid-binding protein
MVFIDTSAWYASVVPSDPRHSDILAWYRANRLPLVTTDYVIDETLTLLRARGEPTRAVMLGRRFFDLDEGSVHYLERSDLRRAWELFRDHLSRGWSFTDCTSMAVIERLHIKHALTLDRHFSEFGGLTVVP